MLKLLCISGSLRSGSTNTALTRAAAHHFGAADVTQANLRLPLYDGDLEDAEGIPAEVREIADQIAAADSVVISTPEYNGALSGVLKNALDWVSRVKGNPWEAKPVVLMAAAAGRAGGARSAYSARLAMVPFRPLMVPAPEVLVPRARQAFAEDGTLLDPSTDKRLAQAMAQLRAAALAARV